MNILEEKGLVKLNKGSYLNGFSATVVFELPDYVSEILRGKYSLSGKPEFAIIRGGLIENNGNSISRADVKKLIRYNLLLINSSGGLVSFVRNDTEGDAKHTGGLRQYITSGGALFTARKYFALHIGGIIE